MCVRACEHVHVLAYAYAFVYFVYVDSLVGYLPWRARAGLRSDAAVKHDSPIGSNTV